MKKIILATLPVILLISIYAGSPGAYSLNWAIADTTVLVPDDKHVEQSKVLYQILSFHHYRKLNIGDSVSNVVFDNYLDALDYNRWYLLESDVQAFESHRTEFDDYMKRGKLSPAYEMYNLYRDKAMARIDRVVAELESGIAWDFTTDETWDIDRENAPWAQTPEELDELWRKALKYQALELKLAGREPEDINKNLLKRYERWQKYYEQTTNEDVFQTLMNAYGEVFDPHTSYFSPATSDNFRINLSQSLEGIGARLSVIGDYTTVAEIIAGGPAFKGGELHENDKIIGVAQGDDGEYVDVIGWRIDDVVAKIRGKKGSIVRLQVIEAEAEPGSAPIEIRIERDKIKLEDASAKGEVIHIQRGNEDLKLGVITIPSFYRDFDGERRGDPEFKSTTRDVRNIIKNMQESEGIDGVLIDLQNNGGGSLVEAIELTGLFIEEGPVVQVRDSRNRIDVNKDQNSELFYDGPVAIMVNRFSASASEIFAGAMQDYDRGVIVGTQSFGKGTVQQLIDIKQFVKSEDRVGQLKLTLAKFYRITGSSTQHRGVMPDVVMPSLYSEEYGESSRPSALPWDQINTTDFENTLVVDEKLLAMLNSRYENRLSEEEYLKNLVAEIQENKEARENTVVSLNEEQRRKEQEEAKKRRDARNKNLGTLENPETGADSDTNAEEVEDPYLREGLNVLADLIAYRVG